MARLSVYHDLRKHIRRLEGIGPLCLLVVVFLSACDDDSRSTITQAPIETPTPVSTYTPVPVPTNTATPSPANTPTPVPTDTPTPTSTPTPVPTDTPTPTSSPTPVPKDTPIPIRTPTPIPTGSSFPSEGYRFVAISSGSYHTCALRENGIPICWGAGPCAASEVRHCYCLWPGIPSCGRALQVDQQRLVPHMRVARRRHCGLLGHTAD